MPSDGRKLVGAAACGDAVTGLLFGFGPGFTTPGRSRRQRRHTAKGGTAMHERWLKLRVLRAGLGASLLALWAVAGPGRAAEPAGAIPWVEAFPTADALAGAFAAEGSTVGVVEAEGQPVLRWALPAGQAARLSLRPGHPLLQRLRYYDRLEFEFRIVSGEIDALHLDTLGLVSGPRQTKVHQWHLGVRTTPRDVWHRRMVEFARPCWLVWDNPDGFDAAGFVAFHTLALLPDTVVEFRNLRFVRNALCLKPDFELSRGWPRQVSWPVKTAAPDGSATYTIRLEVWNTSGRPAEIAAALRSEHSRFGVTVEPPALDLKSEAVGEFKVVATITAADIAALPELGVEPLRVAFTSSAAPAAPWDYEGVLVRPLSPGIRRQVLLGDEELRLLRECAAGGDDKLKQAIGLPGAIETAEMLSALRLDAIPGGHLHPGTSRWLPAVTAGSALPEVVVIDSGRREHSTENAFQFWKEKLSEGRLIERFNLALLAANDEKHSRWAVDLLALYGRQYGEQSFGDGFEPPWSRGPAMLNASRIAAVSTYGTNWYMKWLLEMLSAVSPAPAWTPEIRQAAYEGFALPLATELVKFPGTLNNMTDISNRGLLLLGLVFDDATMVYQATLRDQGLLRRIDDIDVDGFSGEGRPLNYHFGSMVEYLPGLCYLKNSGLPVTLPKDRLLAAVRMPYQRATLWGRVPSAGDNASGTVVGRSPAADYLASLYPEETWLNDIAGGGTIPQKLRAAAEPPPAEGWRALIESTPRLFRTAGFAILRTGETPETQIMVTLDYGRAGVHAHLDRQQITLSAFGKTFSQGPGTIYNASSTWARGPDPRLEAFCSGLSLGSNVVLVDASNQPTVAGRLLGWQVTDAEQIAISRVDGIAPGVSHTRAVVLAHGLVAVLDRMESDTEHTYDSVFHNLGTLSLGDGWQATAEDAPLVKQAGYENVLDLHRLSGAGVFHGRWDLGGTREAETEPASGSGLELWSLPVSGGIYYRGITGMNNPDTSTLADAAPTVIQRAMGKAVDFVTVLEPRKDGSAVRTVAAKDGGVEVTLADGRKLAWSLDDVLGRTSADADTGQAPRP